MAIPLVRYHVAISIDGFIASEDGSFEWLMEFPPGPSFGDFLDGIGGLMMGRESFETERRMGPWSYADRAVLVMTNRPIADMPPGVEMAAGDPASALERLRTRVARGDIWLYGGGVLAGQLLQAGLIDRVELATVPVAIGKGRPLFAGAAAAQRLRLVETRTEGPLLWSVYERA